MQPTALVVDDDRFIRQILQDLLTEGGFRVLQARDGEEGYRSARSHLPDVILLDVMMPKLDGMEVCQRLRTLPQFRYIPVILMTSPTSAASSCTTLNPFLIGADDYVSKPFDGYELITRIQSHLAKYRTLEVLDRKARDYNALMGMTDAVVSSADSMETLRHIVGRIAQIVGEVDRCYIVIFENSRQGFVLASSDHPTLAGLPIDLEKYPEIQKVQKTGEAVFIQDVQKDPIMAPVLSNLSGQAFKSILVFPIVDRGRVTGALVVRAARPGTALSREEIEFCQLVANVSVKAFQNARYLETVREESELLRSAKARLEDELRVKAVYEQLFQNVSEGMTAVNRRGEVVFANRKALEILGYSLDELKATDLFRLLDIGSVRNLFRMRRKGRCRDESNRFDLTVRTRGGEKRLLSVSLNDGPVCEELYLAAFRDVTLKREMEKELQEVKASLEMKNEQLRHFDRVRAEFLNTATHELRTPVTIVNGYCSLVRDLGTENLSLQQKELLNLAVDGSERLIDLINDMLDLSRLEAGKMAMDLSRRNLCEMVQRVYEEFAPLVVRKELQLEIQPAHQTCYAVYDEEKIRRVLVNLIANAIKFTPSGGRIRIALEDSEDQIIIAVEDTGKGIPQERIPDLFEEFVQIRIDECPGGSGLGLSICKKIVEAHKGRIWVDSIPGIGSTFFFTLPKAS